MLDRFPTISPARYRTFTLAALVMLCLIVVTGALVRLTGSGLGCDDWPNCNNDRLIDVSTGHAAIEQVNRLFTGLVSAAVIAAVLASVRRAPRRKDLTWLSLGLVAGVIAQIVLGGITVLVDLHPTAVQGHFLVSMVLCANAIILHRRASLSDEALSQRVASSLRLPLILITAMMALVLVTGTVVTGTGPHSGKVSCAAGVAQPDNVADAISKGCELPRRYGFDVGGVARVHSAAVLATIAGVLWLLWRMRRDDRAAALRPGLQRWLFIAFFQGMVGYIQYFNGIPWVLVAAHVALATLLWLATVDLWFSRI